MKNRKLIVGVDPGVTCGLAVLSLSGELIKVKSQRSLKQPDLIAELVSLGDPIIIAVDVQSPPQLAERIARNFGALLFTPPTFLPVGSKKRLVQDYAIRHQVKLDDQHQKDALAAALKAFNCYKNKFSQLEAHIRGVKEHIPLDEARGLIVQGINIAEAIEILKKEREICEMDPRPVEGKAPPVKSYTDALSILKGRLKEQNLKLRKLRVFIEEKRLEVEAFRRKIDVLTAKVSRTRGEQYVTLRREQEYRRLNLEIYDLRQRVAELEEKLAPQHLTLRGLEERRAEGEVIILKPLSHFTHREVESLTVEGRVSTGEVILLLDASGGGASAAKRLVDRKVRAVIVGRGLSHPAQEELAKADVPILEGSKLRIKWIQNTPYIEAEELERAIIEYRLKSKKNEGAKLQQLLHNYVAREVLS